MSAWHGRGSVNVVGVVKASLNTDWCYGPLHWKAVIYHYLHWEEARAFLEKGRGEGAVNNKIHNIHLSMGELTVRLAILTCTLNIFVDCPWFVEYEIEVTSINLSIHRTVWLLR